MIVTNDKQLKLINYKNAIFFQCDVDVHIKVFKKAIRAKKKIMEVDIINLFGFTLQNNISKWGKTFV